MKNLAEVAVALGMTPEALAQQNIDTMKRIAARLGTKRDGMGNSAKAYLNQAKMLEDRYIPKKEG